MYRFCVAIRFFILFACLPIRSVWPVGLFVCLFGPLGLFGLLGLFACLSVYLLGPFGLFGLLGLFACLSVYLFIYLPVGPVRSIWLVWPVRSVCLLVCLSVCLFACLTR